jgi:hypothetical protein
MSNLISEYYSNDRQKVSMVLGRDSGYRVVCLDSYFETEKETFFDVLDTAEEFAEDWVLL